MTTAGQGPGAVPSLFIATPTADGIAMAGYVEALAGLLLRLGEVGIRATFRTLDGDNLILQRNLLVREFLASKATHLLFIDSDMTFPADLAEKLLDTGKPLIGAVYPKRRLDLAGLRRHLDHAAFDDAFALAQDWNVQFESGRITPSGALAQVQGLPGGFLLIARQVFTLMQGRADVAAMAGAQDAPLSFFRELRQGRTAIDLDYAFCRRYADSGGEVWAYLDADIRHIGEERNAPPYQAFLDAIGARPA